MSHSTTVKCCFFIIINTQHSFSGWNQIQVATNLEITRRVERVAGLEEEGDGDVDVRRRRRLLVVGRFVVVADGVQVDVKILRIKKLFHNHLLPNGK